MPFSVGHITEFVRVNRRFRLEPVLVSNRAVPSLLTCKRALNKAGVSCVFHWVRSHFTKWCFVHTLGTQVVFRPLCSVSKWHFCKRSVARSYGSTESSTENTCTQGPGSHFSTRVQGLDLLFCCTLVQRNQKWTWSLHDNRAILLNGFSPLRVISTFVFILAWTRVKVADMLESLLKKNAI